jgi:uncharacterized protein
MKNNALYMTFAQDILCDETFCRSKMFIQHGAISVYEHSVAVSRLSFSMAEDLRNIDLRALVRGALLHDFFLYDWHLPQNMWSLHGWTHPVTAAENARRIFGISDKEYSLVRTHMWPYTALHPPKYKEGWIICLADKIVSAHETFFRRQNKV